MLRQWKRLGPGSIGKQFDWFNKGGAYIQHPQFEPKPVQLFYADGLHLSQLDNDLLLNNFQGMVEKLLRRVSYTVTRKLWSAVNIWVVVLPPSPWLLAPHWWLLQCHKYSLFGFYKQDTFNHRCSCCDSHLLKYTENLLVIVSIVT